MRRKRIRQSEPTTNETFRNNRAPREEQMRAEYLAAWSFECLIRFGLVFRLLCSFISFLSRLIHSLLGSLFGSASGLLRRCLRICAGGLDVLLSSRVARFIPRRVHDFLGFLFRGTPRFLRGLLRIRTGILSILLSRCVLPSFDSTEDECVQSYCD